MSDPLHPIKLTLLALAGWFERRHEASIAYLKEENRVLRKALGTRRVKLTDRDRRRLAVKGRRLGRKLLKDLATIASPDTILAWHRRLVARRSKSSVAAATGRPPTDEGIRNLVLRLAQENPRWGYSRIVGALKNLGIDVSRSTVANVLRENGIDPAPERRTRTAWSEFLKVHWHSIAATDFFTTKVWTHKGLVNYYVLFFIHLATRRVHIAAVTPNPKAACVLQVARDATKVDSGFLAGKTHLIRDRDSKFTAEFRDVLSEAGVQSVVIPFKSPNLNAHAERFVRSVKEECLDRMIFFGENSLLRALTEFTAHYHGERNHQGLENSIIEPDGRVGSCEGRIRCRERLGGILKYYFRDAA